MDVHATYLSFFQRLHDLKICSSCSSRSVWILHTLHNFSSLHGSLLEHDLNLTRHATSRLWPESKSVQQCSRFPTVIVWIITFQMPYRCSHILTYFYFQLTYQHLYMPPVTKKYRVTIDSCIEDAITVQSKTWDPIKFAWRENNLYYFDTVAEIKTKVPV